MIKERLGHIFASLPFKNLQVKFKKMSIEYLHHFNKISERENLLSEFELTFGNDEYFANSTRFGTDFLMTGSARAKEKPEWVQRAQ